MPEESNQSKFENYSLDFDGSTQRITCTYSAIFNQAEYSISLWLKNGSNSTGGDKGILCADSGTRGWVILQNDQTIKINPDIPGGGTQINTSNFFSTTDTWIHCVITCDGTDLIVYKNGSSFNTDSGGTYTLNANSNDLTIGDDPFAASREFLGKLSQCSIFDYALSETQIKYLYNNNAGGSTPNPQNPMAISGNAPIAYYPLGGSSTGDAAASSPNTLTVPNSSVPSATVFEFNVPSGGIDRITLDQAITLTGNKTFSAWINLTMAQDASGFMFFGEATTNYYLFIQGDYIYIRDASGWSSAQYTPGFSLNTWYHICISGDGTNLIPYVNGEPISGTYADREMQSENTIGSYSNGTFPYRGEMSNVQIWDTNLSGPEVTTIYNNGVPYTGTQPQAANLRAWYPMNVDNANWLGSDWQIADANSAYPQSFKFRNNQPGGGDVVTINNPTYLDNITEFTISFWYNKGILNNPTGKILDRGYTNGFYLNQFRNQGGSANCFEFRVDSSNGAKYMTSPANPTNVDEWAHVCLVWNSTNQIIYVNGVEVKNESSLGGTLNGSGNDLIIGNPGTSLFYNISNFQIWNTTLPATGTDSVETLYNNGTPLTTAIASSNLKTWYKLDNSATFSTNWSVPDASGNGNTGTSSEMTESNLVNNNVSALNGTSSGMNTANLVNSDLTRSIPYSSYSMYFDGLTEDIRCGNSLGSSLSQAEYVTVSCWVYFNNTTEEQGLWNFRSGDNTNDVGTSLSLYSSGAVLRLAYYEGGNNGYVTISNPGFSNGNWYNITCVYDKGAAGKIYIDGQAQTVVDSGIYSTVDFSSDNFYIGSYYSSTYSTNGNLSNIAVWNSELTSDQVLTVYNGGVPNDISSLSPTRWWSLSGDSYFDGNNFICPNLTSSSNNGTSYNLGSQDLVGNGPGSEANGVGTGMNIPGNLQGNAPNSNANAFSVNMNADDKSSSVPDIS